jgi:hypothetical protein
LDGSGGLDSLAETRVLRDDEQNAFEVEAYGSGSGCPALGPPLGKVVELAHGASLDDIGQRHG